MDLFDFWAKNEACAKCTGRNSTTVILVCLGEKSEQGNLYENPITKERL